MLTVYLDHPDGAGSWGNQGTEQSIRAGGAAGGVIAGSMGWAGLSHA